MATSKSLVKNYKTILKNVDIDEAVVSDLTPASVYILATACKSVSRYYLKELAKSVRERFVDKFSVKTLLRTVIDKINQEMSEDIPETVEQFFEDSKDLRPYADKLQMSVSEVVEALASDKVVVVSPRFELYRSAYFRMLSTSADFLIQDGDVIKTFTLIKSKEYSPFSSPSISHNAILMRALLTLQTYGTARKVIFTIRLLGDAEAKDVEFHISRKSLTEPIMDTVKRIITSYGSNLKEKGRHCSECPHQQYCPLLKDITQAYADEAENIPEADK